MEYTQMLSHAVLEQPEPHHLMLILRGDKDA
jgi:hypothetical protein